MRLAAEEDLYARLMALPDNVVGEIINGRLHTQPRPSGRHAVACSGIEIEIGAAYQKGRGGPGGWWILVEPELHLVRDREVLVPDLAGWRRERLSTFPEDHRFEVIPDWVCEVLSPATAKKDRTEKMPAYAHYGVGHLWLVDPLLRTLEVFVLREGAWTVAGLYKDDDPVRAVPFDALEWPLADLWVET